jgi:C-terminal processing protease CtpA/Prc
MNKWLFGIIVGLAIALGASILSYKSLDKQYKLAIENVKAYDAQLSGLETSNRVFRLTMEQMKSMQDSTLRQMRDIQKELKIKDKNLQSVQYITSTAVRTDTITLRDTIFKDPQLSLDTLVKDDWYKLQLSLKYPSTIAVSPEFKSEKYVVVSTKKETVNPPKKFFLFRWFQKKHTVFKVDVVERNPYIQRGQEKYVEIVR